MAHQVKIFGGSKSLCGCGCGLRKANPVAATHIVPGRNGKGHLALRLELVEPAEEVDE